MICCQLPEKINKYEYITCTGEQYLFLVTLSINILDKNISQESNEYYKFIQVYIFVKQELIGLKRNQPERRYLCGCLEILKNFIHQRGQRIY